MITVVQRGEMTRRRPRREGKRREVLASAHRVSGRSVGVDLERNSYGNRPAYRLVGGAKDQARLNHGAAAGAGPATLFPMGRLVAVDQLEAPDGGYFKTIVSDPPWDFDDKGSRMVTPYETMTAEEILGLPTILIADPCSHLYLWVTDTHLELGFQVMRRWGFKYKQTIVWEKVTKAGDPHIGAGHYWRHAHELCLFGVAGGLRVANHSTPSVIRAPRTEHSKKPKEFFDAVETMSPGPRLDMFARGPRDGWWVWGKEANDDQDVRASALRA